MVGKVQFEVAVSIGKVWSSDRVFPDQGEALAYARRAMENPRHDAVRVLRHRLTPAGPVFEIMILHEERPTPRCARAIGPVDHAPACGKPQDVLGLDARLVIGRTLRGFLEAEAITPTELLHSSVHAAKLRKSGLLDVTVQSLAQVQARTLKEPVRGRIARLYDFLTTIENETGEIERQRKALPKFSAGCLSDYVLSVRQAVKGGLEGRVLLASLTNHLADCAGLGQKLDRVLVVMAQGLDETTSLLVEGLMADLLDFPSVLRELFATCPHLGDHLVRLADLLNGRNPDPDAQLGPRLGAVTLLVQAGRAPSCASVLLERLLAEIESGKPLVPYDAEAERAALDQLTKAMRASDGQMLGGQRAEAALARRDLKLRQAMLRKMGLHDVADALPRTWRG